MNDPESLQSIAEMAVALLGVAGLVTVFLAKGELHLFDKVRFVTIVNCGLLIVVFAFVPSWISGGEAIEPSEWRLAAAGAILLQLLMLPLALRLVGREMFGYLNEVVPMPIVLLAQLISVLILGLHALNVLSWPFESNSVLYQMCLLLTLLYGALMFVSIVLFRPGDT